jgi:hypothetical protein
MKNDPGFEEGFAALGGRDADALSVIAEALGASLQTVCNWRQRGVPPNKCRAFASLTGVSVRKLRPRDWRDYWPDEPAPAAVRKRVKPAERAAAAEPVWKPTQEEITRITHGATLPPGARRDGPGNKRER